MTLKTHLSTNFRSESYRLRSEKFVAGGGITIVMATRDTNFAARKVQLVIGRGY